MELLQNIVIQSWLVLEQSAVFMLAGVLAAGLLKALLPGDLVSRHLGRGRVSGVTKAALLGAPLPLCSCGVAPAAAALRAQGAGKGATAAFLVATPETGPDSVAVTWSLLDPLMALVRPLTAILSAIAAGLAVNLSERGPDRDTSADAGRPDQSRPGQSRAGLGQAALAEAGSAEAGSAEAGSNGAGLDCSDAGCCGAMDRDACGQGVSCACGAPARPSLAARLGYGMRYALTDLLPDIGWWFLAGVLVAGTLTALIPDGFIESHLGTGLTPKLVMLAAGIPLYVCATSSTPIAAALALKGLSPGAALVFLLSGPATNAASLAVVGRILGRRATVVYLAALALAALLAGVLTDQLYQALGLDASRWITATAGDTPGLVFTLSAAILPLYLVLFQLRRGPSGHRACEVQTNHANRGCNCTAPTEHTP